MPQKKKKTGPEAGSVGVQRTILSGCTRMDIRDFSPTLIFETRTHTGNFLPDLINTRAHARLFLFDGRDLITFLRRLVNHLAGPARRPPSSFLPSHKIKSFSNEHVLPGYARKSRRDISRAYHCQIISDILLIHSAIYNVWRIPDTVVKVDLEKLI